MTVMQQNLFEELLKFRSDNLKKVSTLVTAVDGQKFIETRNETEFKAEKIDSDVCAGYVMDTKADISVAFIMDGLILGSQDVAAELKILSDFNITHILNVGYKIPNFFESRFIYKNVDILDDPQTDIRTFFDGCIDFIEDGRHEGCVLVHCNAGVSRAPTVVIAYLMKTKQISLKEAISLVKSVRPMARPNEGFMKVLEKYEKEIVLEACNFL